MIIPIKPWLELAESSGGLKEVSLQRGMMSAGLFLAADAEREDLIRDGAISLGESELGKADRMEFYHEPIMGAEILSFLAPVEGKQILDGTLGGGGHSELLLREGAHVIGCDQDGEAISHATKRLQQYQDRFLPVRGNFGNMDDLLAGHGVDSVDGIIMDLGVSSRQLDDISRGFSFRGEAELDMRMDDRSDFSAKELVNEWDEEELIRIFREYGEERRAVKVAKEIVKARKVSPIQTTSDLVEVVCRAIPKTGPKNPATKVFQAIRIAVNRELDVLEQALEKSLRMLSPGGVLAVITFHSLEDRMVKQFMHRRSNPFVDRPEWPEPRENPDYAFSLPSRRAIQPSEEEVKSNPRARSAKLRVAVRI
ncbi:MAG: 16S rRNA (cytosine(1402)-N(4))-methyltransferase RsmH [Verrucomicrobiota bacterium]